MKYQCISICKSVHLCFKILLPLHVLYSVFSCLLMMHYYAFDTFVCLLMMHFCAFDTFVDLCLFCFRTLCSFQQFQDQLNYGTFLVLIRRSNFLSHISTLCCPMVLFFLDYLLLLCVMLQTYVFTNSFSIMETLSGTHVCWIVLDGSNFISPRPFLTCFAFLCLLKSILVDLEDKPSDKTERASHLSTPASGPLISRRENHSTENKDAVLRARNNHMADGPRSKENSSINADIKASKNAPSPKNLQKTMKGSKPNGSDREPNSLHNTSSDTIPTEVIPI